MNLDKEKLANLIDEVTLYKEINNIEIPEIDLYMDQITTFFDDKLGHLKRNEEDPILTKTMINNYTKGKILMPSVNKKYSKDHIILLILIYNLKQTLSINDIELLFSPLIKDSSSVEKGYNLEDIYNSFLEIKKEDLNKFSEFINERIDIIAEKSEDINTSKKNEVELFLLVIMLINQANLQKRLAEKIIDNYFKGNEQGKKTKKNKD